MGPTFSTILNEFWTDFCNFRPKMGWGGGVHLRSKEKLGFARKNLVSPVSRFQFYSLRKRKKWRNSIESLKCSHPYFANTISREELEIRGMVKAIGKNGLAFNYVNKLEIVKNLFSYVQENL